MPQTTKEIPTEVYRKKTHDFQQQAEVVACYLSVMDRLLMLQLALGKPEAGLWGVPAGKIEVGEPLQQGLIRELYEETHIQILPAQPINYIGKLFIRKPHLRYVYHLFHVKFDHQPEVIFSREHTSYRWVNKDEIDQLDLMTSEQEALQHFSDLYTSFC